MPSFLKTLLTPRMLLIVWGGFGALFVLYVIIAAGVQRADRPGAELGGAAEQRPLRDARLLVGEMAEFNYAYTARSTPTVVFNDDPGGAPTRLSDFRGRTLVVNFWATWCAPCKKELPSLNALAGRVRDIEVDVLTVAADPKGRAAAEAALADLGVDDVTALMDKRLALASAIGGQAALPITIIYDRNGDEVGRLVGEADWASQEAEALVRRVAAR